tara:strand:- start:2650 stop:3720 length:1071 start_codon:yes stop_codon:yes gene_type:complete
MSLAAAMIAASVITSVATSAYGAKQNRKNLKKQREDQNLRDLIEGSAPNISNVEEIMVEEIGKENEAILDDSIKQMDYQAQVAQEGADFEAQAQADQGLDQLIQQGLPESLPPELLQSITNSPQGGLSMSGGGPVGAPNHTYYFDIGNIMNMMTDENPQIQNVGMQLSDQMTANPGMGSIAATRDQIQGMAYGGSVRPKKYAEGDLVESEDAGVMGLLEGLFGRDQDYMTIDAHDPEGNLTERSITYSSSEEGDPLVSDARETADFYQDIMSLQTEQEATMADMARGVIDSSPSTIESGGIRIKHAVNSPANKKMQAFKDSLRRQAQLKAKEEGSAPTGKELSDADYRALLPTRFQ